jgi:DNA-binding IclR family transcriptional regulator
MSGPKPKNLVQTIERAAFIFDILSQSPNGLSLGELARKTNLPKGTAHRLLSSMAYFDFIRQESTTRNYHLGFRLVDLGNILLSQIDLRSQARSFLINLSETVKETVHLVVLDNDKALYIDKVDLHPKTSGLQMVSRLGSRLSLHCSSVGKVLLAHMNKTDVEKLFSDTGLDKRTSKTIADPEALRQHLSFVRENGYAIDDEENEEGIRCVAAPIRNGSGKVEAAMSISGPTTRITMERIETELKKLVCETANNISFQLGCKVLGNNHQLAHREASFY